MRVIGICHSFEDFYFEILRYYEPVIHRFVAVSEECADALRRLLPHRYADIHVRPCAIRWPPELQREYAPPGKPLRLLYAGRVVQEQKRVFDLLRLAQELTRQGVNFELRVVGEGKDKPDLERQWQGLHPAVRARVRMEAGVPAHEIAEQFLRADVVVLVSAYEGTSVFMLAGMSYGCVPVVTQVSGTAGTVSPGTTGFVHPVGDLEAMAASIRSLDADRELLARVGANARARSREFDMGAYVAWFEQLLGEAWDQDPPRVWPAERPIRRERLLVRIGKYVPWARPLWRRCRTWMFGGG
jgi:glycosyltransferase involved in cell wall biosynthesis